MAPLVSLQGWRIIKIFSFYTHWKSFCFHIVQLLKSILKDWHFLMKFLPLIQNFDPVFRSRLSCFWLFHRDMQPFRKWFDILQYLYKGTNCSWWCSFTMLSILCLLYKYYFFKFSVLGCLYNWNIVWQTQSSWRENCSCMLYLLGKLYKALIKLQYV